MRKPISCAVVQRVLYRFDACFIILQDPLHGTAAAFSARVASQHLHARLVMIERYVFRMVIPGISLAQQDQLPIESCLVFHRSFCTLVSIVDLMYVWRLGLSATVLEREGSSCLGVFVNLESSTTQGPLKLLTSQDLNKAPKNSDKIALSVLRYHSLN